MGSDVGLNAGSEVRLDVGEYVGSNVGSDVELEVNRLTGYIKSMTAP